MGSRRGVAGGVGLLLVAAACGSSVSRPAGVSTASPGDQIEHGGVEAHLVLLDPTTGRTRSRTALGFPIVQDIVADDGRVVLAGVGHPRSTGMHGDICDGAQPAVRGLDSRSGAIAWSIPQRELAPSGTWWYAPLADATTRDVVLQSPTNEATKQLEVRSARNGALHHEVAGFAVIALAGDTFVAQDQGGAPQLQRQPASLDAFDVRTRAARWRVPNVYAEARAQNASMIVVLAHPTAPAPAGIAYVRGSPQDLAHQREQAQLRLTSFIAAIDLRTGRVRWRHLDHAPTEGQHGAVTIAGDTVVEMVGGEDGRSTAALVAYDLASGRVLWRHPLRGGGWSVPVSDGNTVYINQLTAPGQTGDVVAIDLHTGTTRWTVTSFRTGADGSETYAFDEAVVIGAAKGVVVVQLRYAIVGLRATDGRKLWTWHSGTGNKVDDLRAAVTDNAVAVGQWGLFCSFDD